MFTTAQTIGTMVLGRITLAATMHRVDRQTRNCRLVHIVCVVRVVG